MNLVKLLLVLAVIGGGYQYWQKRQIGAEVKAEMTSTAGPNGFVALPPPSNTKPSEVLVIAAENCPEEGARRSDELAQQLATRNIPYVRAHNASFSFSNPEPAVIERLNAVMNGEVPIVFVNGRAKANPTLEEVIAEYEASR